MGSVLILGGTRDIGHFTALSLLAAGHSVSVLNRGVTVDELPDSVERLRADRSEPHQMRDTLAGRSFDMVLDTTTYNGNHARQSVELFGGNTDRFIFVSTGQVYLVRRNLGRPFKETDYDGELISEPDSGTEDQDAWKYGVEKRDAEDVFRVASRASAFPVTTLRLPMVASERDRRERIQTYIARVLDQEPLQIPDEPGLPIRHVYVQDVARLITQMVGSDVGIGVPYNVSYGQSMSLDQLIALISRLTGREPSIIRRRREVLERAGLLPHFSPLSSRWMSELDNTRSLRELRGIGIRYTPPEEYVRALIDDYEARRK